MSYVKKVGCPACGSRDNVAIYNDGGRFNGKCHGCGELYWNMNPDDPIFHGESENYAAIPKANEGFCGPSETLEEVAGYPILECKSRGWDLEDAKFYGVRSRVDSMGHTDALYYPIRVNGIITGYKRRIIATKQFNVVGNGKNPELIGMENWQGGGDCLVITEGEDDVGAARKMFREMGYNYRVTSVPTGATMTPEGKGVLDKSLVYQLPKIGEFKRVYLCLDQDNPGRAVSIKLAEELSRYCEVYFMVFSEKDARDMQKNGRYKEFIDSFFRANKFVPDTIVRPEDVSLEDLRKPLQKGMAIPYPELNDKLGGLRWGMDGGGELTLLTAGTGIGKTTLAREISKFVIDHPPYPGMKVANIFLEEQYVKTMQGYIALEYGIPLPELRQNPDLLTEQQWIEGKARILDGRTVFHNHFGSLSSDKLLNRLHYMGTREDCKLIILDHISMVVAGQDDSRNGERKDIDLLMHHLANFVTVTGVHVIAIVHLKRSGRRLQRDNEGRVILETAPYHYGGEVTLDDLRGSGGLEQMAMNIIAMEGDVNGLDGRDSTLRWFRILKCREWGILGLAGKAKYNRRNGRLMAVH